MLRHIDLTREGEFLFRQYDSLLFPRKILTGITTNLPRKLKQHQVTLSYEYAENAAFLRRIVSRPQTSITQIKTVYDQFMRELEQLEVNIIQTYIVNKRKGIERMLQANDWQKVGQYAFLPLTEKGAQIVDNFSIRSNLY